MIILAYCFLERTPWHFVLQALLPQALIIYGWYHRVSNTAMLVTPAHTVNATAYGLHTVSAACVDCST